MSSIAKQAFGEIVEDVSEFFAPMSSDLVDGLLGQYGAARRNIEAMAEAVSDPQHASVLHYFISGNVKEQRYSIPSTVETLFNLEGAVGQLNGDFWNRALRLTDVFDYMPQKRREEWHEQIKNPLGRKKNKHSQEAELPALPDFEESTVRGTLSGLLSSRHKFLAERVDGIFRALSRTHVTNRPEGFSKRMIIAGINSWGTSGQINDLRCVIAKFMGREEPKHGATDPVIKAAGRHNGEWMAIDGNSLRIRVYGGVGTAHLEVHPEMSWRLNAILASLYPAAIPSQFREKPKSRKKVKDFELFDKPLPHAVIAMLAEMRDVRERVLPEWPERHIDVPMAKSFGYGEKDKAAQAEAEKVLAAIGAVKVKHYWQFDYHPGEVLDQIVCSGCIPDQKSHQFYPTPESVALAAIELADIQPGHQCLEPSAGLGGLADMMPKSNTVCVEISALHCEVLRAKGHHVECADFLQWNVTGKYDRIVMNPPFSEGRWQAHLEHASSMLKLGGRLVAVLPASAKGKELLPGLTHEWTQIYSNEFSGTSVSVVILTAYSA
ncbi:DUF4942 domain-containing protein [Pseudomonas extremaustralis]|uniref:DUF4942 domain-containing protein n=1 Tax=Pseudomonas extremaustralis TaxID=359110 RepID=A0A5C5QFM9_9PSED|nr:DUF4942 domain-containing protein [Pseudomonas extremaustralis]EZI23159.1 DNA restriction methylase [Pseudomonas extremaustralis 14-3 substr. 14-3b]TWS04229.1 DUF4942 domain-containing protein [Pseudomonas extremaustralis]SDG44560.1 Methyltransferase small domain-containing protein [Pseudomonas extremaustralis]